MNKQVTSEWLRFAQILICEVKDLCEASHDGRPVPEWLAERIEDIEDVLESL